MLDQDQIIRLMERANKSIFVKKFEEASKILELITSDGNGKDYLLAHLRRIELSCRLDNIEGLKENYNQKILSHELHEHTGALCLAFVNQQGNLVSTQESFAAFETIIKKWGKTAAACFGLGFCYELLEDYSNALEYYEISVSLDPNWVPSYFGMSQIYYQLNEDLKGDDFFYLFEKSAPFNLYGNFETHKNLAEEFLANERFDDALTSINLLVEWWVENKGFCPIEINVFSLLFSAKILSDKGDSNVSQEQMQDAVTTALKYLRMADLSEDTLNFLSRLFEDFGQLPMAAQMYIALIEHFEMSIDQLCKVIGHYNKSEQHELSLKILESAYQRLPEQSDIRSLITITKLEMKSISADEYMLNKQNIRSLMNRQSDLQEIERLILGLLKTNDEDPDLYGYLGEIYFHLNQYELAQNNFEKMFDLDSSNNTTGLRYAAYLIQAGETEKAGEILSEIESRSHSLYGVQNELYWLKANLFMKKSDFDSALKCLRAILTSDPWNINYISYEIICLTKLKGHGYESYIDLMLYEFSEDKGSREEWVTFVENTEILKEMNHFEIAYSRSKVQLLYQMGNEQAISEFVECAKSFDPNRAYSDLLKLLNTNFDSPRITWALGFLSNELWQFEVAGMWFQQLLDSKDLSKETLNLVYTSLADCLVWKNTKIGKALELINAVKQSIGNLSDEQLLIDSHINLKLGNINEAQTSLDLVHGKEYDFESKYLKGLLQYRNGQVTKAKAIWKPLLTVNSDRLRYYQIKQDLLKFYFSKEDYLKAN